MGRWGRDGTALVSSDTGGSRRFGRRSIWLALIAFAIGLTSLILWMQVPKDATDDWQEKTTVAFMIAFLGVTPLLHLIGFIFALFAVFRAGENRALGFLGLLLNSVAVLIVVGLVYFAATSIGSFT